MVSVHVTILSSNINDKYSVLLLTYQNIFLRTAILKQLEFEN